MSQIINRVSIIEANNKQDQSILFESLHPYLKSLYIYYKDLFGCEPVLMVTDVFNACQYAKIVPANDFNEAINAYLNVSYIEVEQDNKNFDSDLFAQYETINFNSKMLIDLIK
jgi:hypothetical protein